MKMMTGKMTMSDPSIVSEKATWCMNNFDDLIDVLDLKELGTVILPNLTPVGIDKLYDLMQEADSELDPSWSYGGSK
jgi:hypothetical protein